MLAAYVDWGDQIEWSKEVSLAAYSDVWVWCPDRILRLVDPGSRGFRRRGGGFA
jgi:hypothetical protein